MVILTLVHAFTCTLLNCLKEKFLDDRAGLCFYKIKYLLKSSISVASVCAFLKVFLIACLIMIKNNVSRKYVDAVTEVKVSEMFSKMLYYNCRVYMEMDKM